MTSLVDAPTSRQTQWLQGPARGGDIDLLIDSPSLGRSQLRQIRLDLQDRLGVQHFDLVLLGPKPSAFARAVVPHAVPL